MKVRERTYFEVFARASFDALPVVAGIGLLLGLVVAFESATYLKLFGAETFVANLLALSLFRELGPLITAVVLSGRSGSAFAAEIGTMKANEELAALRTMGVSPVGFLLPPRLFGAAVAMPLLTLAAELAGLFGGLVVLEPLGVPTAVYWGGVTDSLDLFVILLGTAKSVVFGGLVAIIGTVSGLTTSPDADGVGKAATRAVVMSIVAIAVTDGAFAVICSLMGV